MNDWGFPIDLATSTLALLDIIIEQKTFSESILFGHVENWVLFYHCSEHAPGKYSFSTVNKSRQR